MGGCSAGHFEGAAVVKGGSAGDFEGAAVVKGAAQGTLRDWQLQAAADLQVADSCSDPCAAGSAPLLALTAAPSAHRLHSLLRISSFPSTILPLISKDVREVLRSNALPIASPPFGPSPFPAPHQFVRLQSYCIC